jgi:WD40 repeat protein/beta-lactamase regulating signal transducer with metallopeptidase domain
MPPFMQLGLANAVCAAVLAVLALAAERLVRRPALTHCLWLLVLVKLVTPPLFPLSLAWLPADTPAASAPATEAAPAPLVVTGVGEPELVGPLTPGDAWREMEKERAKRSPLQAEKADKVGPAPALAPQEVPVAPAPEAPVLVSDPPPPVPEPTASPPQQQAPPRPDNGSGVATFLGVIWIAGSVVWFVRAVRQLVRFQRLLCHARPAPANVRALAERLARQLGLRRCPEVALVPGPLPPMIWAALGRVRLLLPGRLLDRLDEEQTAALLAHELAHVRRGDHWVRRLEFVVLGLYWWYPLVWLARARLQAAEEECCDAWVVEELPARAYASAIVETVDFLAAAARATLPALASGLGRVEALKRRLTLILSGTAPKRLSAAARLAVLALAAGLLPLLPTLAARPDKKTEEPAPKQEAPRADAAAGDEALSFRPEALELTGGEHQVAALGVSRDGRFLATGNGFFNRPGEVRVYTIPEHKEVLSYPTPQGVAWVAFSPDGRYIASSGYDSQGVIREFPSGKLVAVLALDGPARLAFSADGRTLVTVTESNTIKVWETATGAEVRRIDGTTHWYCIALSRDGKYLATGGGDIGQNQATDPVTVWDTTTWKPVGKLQGTFGSVMCVTFSPDGKTIATGCTDGATRLWQLDGLKLVATLEGHEDWVKAITFTPDGKTLVTASHDGSVRLWDVEKRMAVNRLDGHVAPVRSVAVTPDGKTLFTGGALRILKVWDLATAKETASYQPAQERPEETSIILATVYSPDGKLLATAHENGLIQVRRAASGDVLRTLRGHEEAVTCLVFSKDGKMLISGSSDQTVRLWDVETGKQRAALAGHASWVYALALSPDGKLLATGGYDKTVRLWDMETLKEQAVLTGHKGAVRALAFSPDGKTLASGAGDHTIKLWDLETRKEKTTLAGHEGTVRSLMFSPDGRMLASGSEDATIRLWDAAGTAKTVLKGHGSGVTAVRFSPGGRYLVSAGMDATLRLWDVTAEPPRQAQNLRGHSDGVTCLAWTPDGRFVATAGFERSVRLWAVTTGTLRVLNGHTGPVRAAVFSPDGRYVLSCGGWPGGDKTLRLWDVRTGKEIRKFEGHADQLSAAAFSPDGKTILSGGADKVLRWHDAESGKLLREFPGHAGPIGAVAFAPDGKTAVSAGQDKTLRVWDLESGRCLHELSGHTGWVRGVAFTPDGKTIVSAGRDSAIRVWDADKGVEVKRIDMSVKPVDVTRGWIEALALSPDGKRVVVGQNETVYVVDLGSGDKVRQFYGHGEKVLGVAFAPDGRTVLSGGSDATARWWDVETGRELHVFRGHRNWVWAVNFSPEGRRLLTAGGGARDGEEDVAGQDFTIRLWLLPDPAAQAGRVLKNKLPDK